MLSLLAIVTLPSARDLTAFAPELLAVATIMLVLLLPLFLPKRRVVGLIPAITALGGVCAAATAAGVYCASRNGDHLLGGAFSGLLVADGLSCFLRMLI